MKLKLIFYLLQSDEFKVWMVTCGTTMKQLQYDYNSKERI